MSLSQRKKQPSEANEKKVKNKLNFEEEKTSKV